MLSVSDKDALYSFIEKVKSRGLKHSVFVEPDMDNEITAVALEPSERAQKLCSNLPLMFKEYKGTWKKSI